MLHDASCFETSVSLYSAERRYVPDIRYLRNENLHERLSWSCRRAVNQTVEVFSLASVEVACSNLDPGHIIHVSFFIPSRQANAWYTHFWLQN